MEHKAGRIVKSVGIMSLATSASRVLGYIRDAINATLFGAGIVSDAFFVAYRIPNMLRDLLAEGALSAAFIPTFVDYLEKKGKEEAFRLANIVISLLVIIFSFIVILGIIFAPFIVRVMAPGFVPDAILLTIKLTRILFPFIAFMGLASVMMGMLNSLNHFTIPALAPAVGNLMMIITGVAICPFFADKPDTQVIYWALGALASGLVQVAIQLPVAMKKGFRLKPLIDLSESGVSKMAKMMLPAVFSNSVSQINIVLVNTIIASMLGPATVTYLYYGFRMMQLPLGIFGVAIAAATFPLISSHIAKKELPELKDTLSLSLRLNFFIAMPATLGLIVLSYPINNLLFHHGRFTEADTLATSWAAIYYTTGLIFAACIKILNPTFFALGDSKTPVTTGIIAILFNIFLSLVLMRPLGYKGLAIASSAAALLNFILLYHTLEKKIGSFLKKDTLASYLRISLASLIMAGVCFITARFISGHFNLQRVPARALHAFGPILIGLGVYLASAHLLKVKEINLLTGILKEKFGKTFFPQSPSNDD